jgi:hypothetical protein
MSQTAPNPETHDPVDPVDQVGTVVFRLPAFALNGDIESMQRILAKVESHLARLEADMVVREVEGFFRENPALGGCLMDAYGDMVNRVTFEVTRLDGVESIPVLEKDRITSELERLFCRLHRDHVHARSFVTRLALAGFADRNTTHVFSVVWQDLFREDFLLRRARAEAQALDFALDPVRSGTARSIRL